MSVSRRIRGFGGATIALAGVALTMAFVGGAAAERAPRFAEGVIARFECGDNCYLTIRRDSGDELTGLCAAPRCAEWNEIAEMPKAFKGRRVRVTIGRGKQYDGAGNLMGTTTSFEQIGFIK